MEKITAILEGLDLTKLVPEVDSLLGAAQAVAFVALLLGPVLMLLFGLFCFFLPPKEANHRMGFRTWFGMGSVEAWRFTQRLAGIVWGGLGLILTVVMGIICLVSGGKDTMALASTAFVCLIWQAALALIAYLVLCLIIAIRYDSKGKRR